MKNPTDYQSLFTAIVPELAIFLERELSSIYENWWQEAVLENLSFQQREHVERSNVQSLNQLDLAALLRIMDSNWYRLAPKLELRREDRHYVKEMQSIRNRWAHVPASGYSEDDVYRDLDTLYRLARLVNGGKAFLAEIAEAKDSVIGSGNSSRTTVSSDAQQRLAFQPGEMVEIVAEPGLMGAVMSVFNGESESRYDVFVSNQKRSYYHSQLRSSQPEVEVLTPISVDRFHAFMTALHIKRPTQAALYSLNSARIDFIPYQFRPVVKFVRADRPRLLIADGVGVGKTIEAGLVLQELKARRTIDSVLVVCPRALVTERKWFDELKRFGERFTQLNGEQLRYCIEEYEAEGQWPTEHKRTIVPYSLLDETLLHGRSAARKRKRRPGLVDLDPAPHFDLLIVDEAHHIRNPGTQRHEVVKFLAEHSEAVLFLSATPLQMDSDDLFVLLNTLRPDLVIDKEAFRHMAEPNAHINNAIRAIRLKADSWVAEATSETQDALRTDYGERVLQNHPGFQNTRARLTEHATSDEDRIAMINELEDAHSFSGIISRTRRRDIGQFTVRKPQTVPVAFTPEQKAVHDKIIDLQASIFSLRHPDANVRFFLTTIRRQASSCLPGLVPHLSDILYRHSIDEGFFDTDMGADEEPSFDHSLEQAIEELLKQASVLPPEDPKFDKLSHILTEKTQKSNHRTMVFSTFRHTLSYLHRRLQEHGYRVGVVHGGVGDDERVDLRHRFRREREDPEAIDVLLFSEVGSEGLDYQFCDCIVNYDLPWNPMKIEQRIGRIDRNGQRSESVLIYNFVTPGTVEAEIHDRCLVRIDVFNQALGEGEAILGEIARNINEVAVDFSLSKEERETKFQQIADNEIRLYQESERLEEQQMELFSIRAHQSRMDEEIETSTSFWLLPESIQRLVEGYIMRRCELEKSPLMGEKSVKTLRLSSESRTRLLYDYRKLPQRRDDADLAWEKWLKGGEPHLPVVFSAGDAAENLKAAFLMPIHPLVRQASEEQAGASTPIVERGYALDSSSRYIWWSGFERKPTPIRMIDTYRYRYGELLREPGQPSLPAVRAGRKASLWMPKSCG